MDSHKWWWSQWGCLAGVLHSHTTLFIGQHQLQAGKEALSGSVDAVPYKPAFLPAAWRLKH